MNKSEKIKRSRKREIDNLSLVDFQLISLTDLRLFLVEKLKTKSPNNLTRYILVNYPNIYMNIDKVVPFDVLTTKKFMEKVYRVYHSDTIDINSKIKCEKCGSDSLKFYSFPVGYGFHKNNTLCSICSKKGGEIRFKRKYGEVEGILKYKEFLDKKKGQLSLDWFKLKYGEIEGTQKYNEYWKYNFSQRKNLNYSKISQELFWEIYNNLDSYLQKRVMFSELNKEKRINLNKHDKKIFGDDNRVCFFMDFSIGKKICIEFDGEYWHKDSEDVDFKKDLIMKSKGYNVLRIGELDYKNNKEIVKERCLSFIKEFYDINN